MEGWAGGGGGMGVVLKCGEGGRGLNSVPWNGVRMYVGNLELETG